jgi:two-component system sensor histidine kinase BaeS
LQGELEALRDGIRPMSATNINSLWQEIRRISCLVDDLHLLSQADAGSLSYNWQAVDLDELIADVLSQFSRQFANLELTVAFQAVPALVNGDAARLTQLWVNLAQNTLRYTDAQGQLQINMAIVQQRVVVTWQDSSPGVDEADLPRLTERLFRVDSSRNRASGGSGLGLSIVQAIAQAHQACLQPSVSPLGGLCWTLSFALKGD